MPLRESALPNTPPEGPAILSAIVRNYGAIPSIIDLNAYRIKDNIAKNKSLKNGRHITTKEFKSLFSWAYCWRNKSILIRGNEFSCINLCS